MSFFVDWALWVKNKEARKQEKKARKKESKKAREQERKDERKKEQQERKQERKQEPLCQRQKGYVQKEVAQSFRKWLEGKQVR